MHSLAKRIPAHLLGLVLTIFGLILASSAGATERPPAPIAPSSFLHGAGQVVGLGDKCLDVFQSGTADGTPVVLFDCHGTANQLWNFDLTFDGSYEIHGIGGKCLQPGGVGTSGHPELVIGPCGGAEDRWLISGFIPYDFHIIHSQTGECVDVLQSSTANLTPIILFDCRGTANQDWRFEPNPNAPPSCFPTATSTCLNQGRFRVSVSWRNFQGDTGSGQVVPFSADDSGLFWFFAADNVELLVKVLDGCPINDRYWVFAAATTNVEYTLTVTDTEHNMTEQYFNPLGRSAPAITDTDAFATCP